MQRQGSTMLLLLLLPALLALLLGAGECPRSGQTAASWGSRDSGDQGWGQCTQWGQTRAFLTELPSRASAPGRWLGEWTCGYRDDLGAGISTRDSARGLSPAPTSFPHSHCGSPGTQTLQGGGKDCGPFTPPHLPGTPAPSTISISQPSYALILPICPALNLPSDPSSFTPK